MALPSKCCGWLLIAVLALANPSTVPAQESADKLAFFETRVRPLLAQRCYTCHSEAAGKKKGGLALDKLESLQRGGSSGPLFVAGKPSASLLIRAIHYQDEDLRMPPSGKLAARDIAVLEQWIQQGAVLPRALAASGAPSLEQGRKHWAFQPLRREAAPAVKQPQWVRKPHDAWILAAMEKQGLSPSAPADPRTLLRRLHFNLVGLPPAPEQLEQFQQSAIRNPQSAIEQVVEQLLTSPHHGERWGRYWLDLARYCDIQEAWADTKGQPYLYRDWVVRALNDDMPYDRFARLQLAADLMPATQPKDLAALGFLGLSPSYWKELQLPRDIIRAVVSEEWEERIGTVSATYLGLTVACARCHDHKFDPISTEDYYALAGVFASTRLSDRPLLLPERAAKVTKARVELDALETKVKTLNKAKPPMKQQIEAVQAQIKKLRAEVPEVEQPLAVAVDDASLSVEAIPNGTKLVYKAGEACNVAVQKRGEPTNEGPMVPRRFLSVLSAKATPFTQGSGRRELADAMFTDAAPLAARVIVNRVWKLHFGRGLVETPSDFGTQGERPSHPELLDDLAARFVEHGWSLRWLHREIVLSATYQQASSYDEAKFKIDPDNRWLWRMSRKRLDAEAWRDAMLAVAGNLQRAIGGPPQATNDGTHLRRTLYSSVKRRELSDYLRLHDFPDPLTHSPNRLPTTTPLQQLFTLNSPLMLQQAKALASRLKQEATTEQRIRRAFVLAYGRAATAHEVEVSAAFLHGENVGMPISEAAWEQFAQAILGSNELQFVD